MMEIVIWRCSLAVHPDSHIPNSVKVISPYRLFASRVAFAGRAKRAFFQTKELASLSMQTSPSSVRRCAERDCLRG